MFVCLCACVRGDGWLWYDSAHLVPIMSFGENDIFNQVDNSHGSRLRRVQVRCYWLAVVVPSAPIVVGCARDLRHRVCCCHRTF